MKAKPRVLLLTVAEVEDMLASLEAARTLRDLTGQQRQQLQEAYDLLECSRTSATGGKVPLSIDSIVAVLRCAAMTQGWLSSILSDMSAVEMNE